MKNKRTMISTILIIFIIFSAAGLVFAAGGTGSGGGTGTGGGTGNGTTNGTTNGTASAKISVAFDKTEAKVGDNVTITVTITNDGTLNLTNILVLAPLPEGLKYLLHATDTSKSNYTSTDGIWNVGNLKTTSKLNGVKYLYITAEVLPEAAGKEITATAKYLSVEPETADPAFIKPGKTTSNILKIQKNTTETNSSKNGNSTGNSIHTNTTDKKTTLAKVINATQSGNALKTLQNSNKPSDQGKSYEISNATGQSTSTPFNTFYAVLGILGVATLVGFGYFKGFRN